MPVFLFFYITVAMSIMVRRKILFKGMFFVGSVEVNYPSIFWEQQEVWIQMSSEPGESNNIGLSS